MAMRIAAPKDTRRRRKRKRRGGRMRRGLTLGETSVRGGKSMILELGMVQRKEVSTTALSLFTMSTETMWRTSNSSMDTKVLNS